MGWIVNSSEKGTQRNGASSQLPNLKLVRGTRTNRTCQRDPGKHFWVQSNERGQLQLCCTPGQLRAAMRPAVAWKILWKSITGILSFTVKHLSYFVLMLRSRTVVFSPSKLQGPPPFAVSCPSQERWPRHALPVSQRAARRGWHRITE